MLVKHIDDLVGNKDNWLVMFYTKQKNSSPARYVGFCVKCDDVKRLRRFFDFDYYHCGTKKNFYRSLIGNKTVAVREGRQYLNVVRLGDLDGIPQLGIYPQDEPPVEGEYIGHGGYHYLTSRLEYYNYFDRTRFKKYFDERNN